ncbi:major capsid protein [Terrihalobacillus insolitus]|uniref:major capsid protein n=1 Tax=Terrihalobacillus insolitus TaxID=2950438 RepID=UPI0023409AE5|nr:phage major capsid protein [Terrihalobacillus insolitus]MDC3413967.1 phage major capsid protein [Terrihalobacillus insolitus]
MAQRTDLSLTLTEHNLTNDTLQRGVVSIFAQTSPVIELLPFMTISGNSYKYNQEGTLPNVEFRDVNKGYTPSSGTVVQKSESLMILGGDVDVDKFVAQTMGNVNNQRAVQTNMKSKQIAKTFTNKFFKGDKGTNPLEFDGLNARISNNANELVAGDTGAVLSLALLHELLDMVEGGADVLFMGKAMRRELQKLLEGQTHYIQVGKDNFGRPIEYFGDVQIRTVEDDILGFNETIGDPAAGGRTDSGSIYAVKFGAQEAISGLTNGGVQVYDLGEIDAMPVYRTRIEFYCGLADFHPKAAARLKGVVR